MLEQKANTNDVIVTGTMKQCLSEANYLYENATCEINEGKKMR